jgi:hypothetical protein
MQRAAGFDGHERAGRAGHPWFEGRFGHRGSKQAGSADLK